MWSFFTLFFKKIAFTSNGRDEQNMRKYWSPQHPWAAYGTNDGGVPFGILHIVSFPIPKRNSKTKESPEKGKKDY